ncbi:hypothetical protein SAMN05518801_1123 [Novosphingobium sp. CF614]|uniref:hypothetical protein n=1 Tax=Novosphingobium sp. CF614 TaxID=1884364 RepID=UPI0008EE10BA|nr:hypothetical protein [Novosphingobium sp. CF614]SFG24520.1 hypothetical protein SAMN05518801_1123 [Novosphingobium sp. CF614]
MIRIVFAAGALALLAGAAPRDDFARTVAALRAGMSGEATGQAEQTAAAASALAALGAHPVEGAADLAAQWRGEASPAYRERVLGPAYLNITLQPGGRYALEQSFLAGRRARVAAFPTIPIRFRLQVNDGDQERSCSVREGTANCDWVPVFTGRVRVKLMNAGKRPAKFVIVMQ